MKDILESISNKAIQLGERDFKGKTWLGIPPASKNDIISTEQRLSISLPEDVKQFYSLTNGFLAPNEVEPTFCKVSEIDYLKNIETYTIEAFSIEGIEHIGEQLERSIVIGGIDEEQYFLLIPPIHPNEKWKYWKFAAWLQGEEEYEGMEDYFNHIKTSLK